MTYLSSTWGSYPAELSSVRVVGTAAQSWDIWSVSPSEAIVWDEVLVSFLGAWLAPLMIYYPESQWLWPPELAPAEGAAHCTQTEPVAHSSRGR